MNTSKIAADSGLMTGEGENNPRAVTKVWRKFWLPDLQTEREPTLYRIEATHNSAEYIYKVHSL